ncbi:MAG: 6-bladed beta-propeller [Balneolaceae bacterium]
MSIHQKSVPALLFFLFMITSGCGSAYEESTPDLTGFPEWSLTHEFDITEPDNVMFGNIFTVGVLSTMELIVPDYSSQQFYHFAADGSYLSTFSRQGGGPGEMDRINSIAITENDDLAVFDSGLMRFTTFRQQQGRWEHTDIRTLDDSAPTIGQLFDGPGDHFFAVTNNVFSIDNLQTDERLMAMNQIDAEGRPVRDSLAVEVTNTHLVNVAGQGFSVRTIPGGVGRTNYFSVADRRYVVSADSDAFAIRVMDTETDNRHKIRYAVEPVPLTEEEKQGILRTAGSNFRSQMRDKMPDYRRVIRSLLTDNRQHIWVQITTTNDEEPNWVVLNIDGSPAGRLSIPQNAQVRAILDDRIYALVRPDDAAPMIRVFSFSR